MSTPVIGCLPFKKDYVSYVCFDLPVGVMDTPTNVSLTSTEPEFSGTPMDCYVVNYVGEDVIARWPGYDPIRRPFGGTRQINITITIKGTKGGAAVADVVLNRVVMINPDKLRAAPP
jgi:hypothetical protein